jgi:hypothetical protein
MGFPVTGEAATSATSPRPIARNATPVACGPVRDARGVPFSHPEHRDPSTGICPTPLRFASGKAGLRSCAVSAVRAMAMSNAP